MPLTYDVKSGSQLRYPEEDERRLRFLASCLRTWQRRSAVSNRLQKGTPNPWAAATLRRGTDLPTYFTSYVCLPSTALGIAPARVLYIYAYHVVYSGAAVYQQSRHGLTLERVSYLAYSNN